MKQIPLSKGLVAIIDDDDYERLRQFHWHAMRNKSGFYARRNRVKNEDIRTPLYMHRIIMKAPAGLQVDHINHNTLDNRKSNLRLCSPAQNGQYKRKKRCRNTSRFKGVYWEPERQKWVAAIHPNYRNMTIGRYSDEVEAALAYNQKARELYGDFAHLNTIR